MGRWGSERAGSRVHVLDRGIPTDGSKWAEGIGCWAVLILQLLKTGPLLEADTDIFVTVCYDPLLRVEKISRY
jgi:hypothetical protein